MTQPVIEQPIPRRDTNGMPSYKNHPAIRIPDPIVNHPSIWWMNPMICLVLIRIGLPFPQV